MKALSIGRRDVAAALETSWRPASAYDSR